MEPHFRAHFWQSWSATMIKFSTPIGLSKIFWEISIYYEHWNAFHSHCLRPAIPNIQPVALLLLCHFSRISCTNITVGEYYNPDNADIVRTRQTTWRNDETLLTRQRDIVIPELVPFLYCRISISLCASAPFPQKYIEEGRTWSNLENRVPHSEWFFWNVWNVRWLVIT